MMKLPEIVWSSKYDKRRVACHTFASVTNDTMAEAVVVTRQVGHVFFERATMPPHPRVRHPKSAGGPCSPRRARLITSS